MPQLQSRIQCRLAHATDIPAVKNLLDRYHVKNLSEQQRGDGFVTTDMTEQQLLDLCLHEQGIIIAEDLSSQQLVGLLLGESWDFLAPWPIFAYLSARLSDYQLQQQPLNRASSYQYGPICVAEQFRGLGIGEAMLSLQRKHFSDRYAVMATFINVLNARSLAFHLRNGFEKYR